MITPILLAAGLAFSNPEFLALSLECLIRLLVSFHKRGLPTHLKPTPKRRRKPRPPPHRQSSRKSKRRTL